jgi:tetratricopeptide (TPR) repeat protein
MPDPISDDCIPAAPATAPLSFGLGALFALPLYWRRDPRSIERWMGKMLRVFAALLAILAAASAACADARKDCFDKSGEIAIQNCTEALRLSPNDIKLYLARGYEYNHAWNQDRGSPTRMASRPDPQNADAYHGRGYAYNAKGEYDLAIAEFNKTIRLKPANYVAISDRGIAYYNKGQYDRAIENQDRALKLKPDYAAAIKNRVDAIAKKISADGCATDFRQSWMRRQHQGEYVPCRRSG